MLLWNFSSIEQVLIKARYFKLLGWETGNVKINNSRILPLRSLPSTMSGNHFYSSLYSMTAESVPNNKALTFFMQLNLC